MMLKINWSVKNAAVARSGDFLVFGWRGGELT